MTAYPKEGPDVVWCGEVLTCKNGVGESVSDVGRMLVQFAGAMSSANAGGRLGSFHDVGVTSYPKAGPNVVWCEDALTCSYGVGELASGVGRVLAQSAGATSSPITYRTSNQSPSQHR